MPVSRQGSGSKLPDRKGARRGPRARMKKRMLDAAMSLMQEGRIPSVSDVAAAAEVSRATAYRYFPSQAKMVQETVNKALGPILEWRSQSSEAGERVSDLIRFAYPRLDAFEATHRAALLIALDQWTRDQAGELGDEKVIKRGRRRQLLGEALKPLRGRLDDAEFDRLAQSLSLIFGSEALIVLKDIWGLDEEAARDVAIWAASALVRAAAETAPTKAAGSVRGARTVKRRTRRTVN
ncbi:MAG: TetR/AcrR family transcriptional regulator [Hyphomicrobiales bacterium]|nr:TetR/AcrR family transcriptional regulator [Hyphomicrobiales bacterium]